MVAFVLGCIQEHQSICANAKMSTAQLTDLRGCEGYRGSSVVNQDKIIACAVVFEKSDLHLRQKRC
jgi:hypothetical protein